MKKQTAAAQALFLCATLLALSIFSAKAKAGAQNGLALCEKTIIPSLLPVLTVANLMLKSAAGRFLERVFGFAARWLRLPQGAVTPILFGLLAGFPAGAVLTCAQAERGEVSVQDARRMMSFNFCGGTAFCISAVGVGYYGSARAGAVLYGANVLSSLLIAAGTALRAKGDIVKKSVPIPPLPFSDALCEAVQQTCESILLMCAYIVLFCTVASLLPLPPQVFALVEITTGIFAGGSALSLPMCAFFTGFGGLCIHLQILAILRKTEIRYGYFLFYRVLGAVLAWGLCKLFLLLFPETASVAVNTAQSVTAEFTQTGTAFGVLTLLGCVWLVLDIEHKKIRL